MIYLQLFLQFMMIGILAFGGGYAVLPLIQQQCVNISGWLTMTEFSDLLTISQITPGPIAINSASFVGMKVAGTLGAVTATLGFMLPPFIITSIIYWIFKKYGNLNFMQDLLGGLKPGAVALIAVAAFDVLKDSLWAGGKIILANTDIFSGVLALGAFFVMRKFKFGVIKTILSCGVVGILWDVITKFIA